MKVDLQDIRQRRFINTILVILLVIFIYLVRNYLVALILALIFAALLRPVYHWFLKHSKKKKNLSAALTTILFLLVIAIPTAGLLEEIIRQAIQLSKEVAPLIQQSLQSQNDQAVTLPSWLPFRDVLEPYTADIMARIGNAVGNLSNWILDAVGQATSSTAVVLLNLFIMLYGLFSFVRDGEEMDRAAQKYLPLTSAQYQEVKSQIINVSRATLKGALVIGLVQGLLMGLAFWVCGLPGPLFWAAVTALASLIPGIGAALVYLPAGIYLLATGEHTAGVGMLIWGFGVVGTVDNFLRPVLVGKDVAMSDILVLVSTLGGIGLFGLSGIILGPMIVVLLTAFLNFSAEID